MGHRMHNSRIARVGSIISQLLYHLSLDLIASSQFLRFQLLLFDVIPSLVMATAASQSQAAQARNVARLHRPGNSDVKTHGGMVHCILRDKNESTAQGDISEFLQLLGRFSFLRMYSRSRCLASKITTLNLRSKTIHLSTQQPLQEQQQSHLHLRVPGPS